MNITSVHAYWKTSRVICAVKICGNWLCLHDYCISSLEIMDSTLPSSDSFIAVQAWIFSTVSTASSVVSVDETTLAITSSFRPGNMTHKWFRMVWESSYGWQVCPGTSMWDWLLEDDDWARMSGSARVTDDDDDGPGASWLGWLMSIFAIFALFGLKNN